VLLHGDGYGGWRIDLWEVPQVLLYANQGIDLGLTGRAVDEMCRNSGIPNFRTFYPEFMLSRAPHDAHSSFFSY